MWGHVDDISASEELLRGFLPPGATLNIEKTTGVMIAPFLINVVYMHPSGKTMGKTIRAYNLPDEKNVHIYRCQLLKEYEVKNEFNRLYIREKNARTRKLMNMGLGEYRRERTSAVGDGIGRASADEVLGDGFAKLSNYMGL